VTERDQYFAQIVPNTETTYQEAGRATIAALAALVDRIGPAVMVVHSQSGAYGLGVAATPACAEGHVGAGLELP
jgi:hypothetical protein